MSAERVRGLLEPAARDARSDRGYVDVIADGAVGRSGSAQGLMFSRAVPFVYERIWRPAWGRLAKGPLGPSMAGEARLARELLAPAPGDRVLDIGCGPGNFTRSLARAVAPDGLVVGVDASPTMLARAVRDTPAGAIAYVRGDAEALPFGDASFDAVCCFATLNLLHDPWRALDEQARVLAPGGRVALLTSCRPPLMPAFVADAVVGRTSGMRVFGRDELVDALSQRGFADVTRRIAGVVQIVAGARM